MERRATLKSGNYILSCMYIRYRELSTYRLVVDGGCHGLEPFQKFIKGAIRGTRDAQVTTLVRYSSVEKHRRMFLMMDDQATELVCFFIQESLRE